MYMEAVNRTVAPVAQDGDTLTFALPFDFKVEDIRFIEERFPNMRLSYVLAKKEGIRRVISAIYTPSGRQEMARSEESLAAP